MSGLRWLVSCSLLLVGCMSYPEQRPGCAKGLSEVEGQCVPVATVVFRQCMEAFRTESVEHDRSQELSIGASAKGYGDAKLQRSKQDLQRKEFSGAAASDSEVVIAECRRQEQAERDSQLERAWAAADLAESELRVAKAETAEATRALTLAQAELEAQKKQHEQTAAELQALADKLAGVETELAQQRGEIKPACTPQEKSTCGSAAAEALAAGDHRLAHERYALACEAGQADACGDWGLLFERGLGVAADPARARELYARGCELDDDAACANLAVALEREGG